jgi:hypothetical protein
LLPHEVGVDRRWQQVARSEAATERPVFTIAAVCVVTWIRGWFSFASQENDEESGAEIIWNGGSEYIFFVGFSLDRE